MREGYRAREEPPKYPNLAARWEGGGYRQWASCSAPEAMQTLRRSNLLQEQGRRICCLPPFQDPALP